MVIFVLSRRCAYGDVIGDTPGVFAGGIPVAHAPRVLTQAGSGRGVRAAISPQVLIKGIPHRQKEKVK